MVTSNFVLNVIPCSVVSPLSLMCAVAMFRYSSLLEKWILKHCEFRTGDGDQFQKALEVLSEMKGLGLCPNSITFSILIVASEK